MSGESSNHGSSGIKHVEAKSLVDKHAYDVRQGDEEVSCWLAFSMVSKKGTGHCTSAKKQHTYGTESLHALQALQCQLLVVAQNQGTTY